MSLDALIQRCAREIDEGVLPACQVAVAKDGELLAFRTYGDATDSSRFTMFSSTKAIASSATWKLLSEGTLSLDQRVADILDGFGDNGKDAITVEQLMLHIAGIPSSFPNPYERPERSERVAQMAAWPLEWEPGSRYVYHALSSNAVQSEIVEQITGRDFYEYLRTEIVEPLGLKRFQLGTPVEDQADVLDCVVCGEPVTQEELFEAWGMDEVPPEWASQAMLLMLNDPRVRAVGIPAGGGVSTAADVAMFYQHVLANTGDLWRRDVLDQVIDRQNSMPDTMGVPTGRGLGIQVNGTGSTADNAWWYGFGKGNGPRAFGHDGAAGQIAWANPDTGVSFCYLTNGLDENMLRQKRRMLGIGSRAAALKL